MKLPKADQDFLTAIESYLNVDSVIAEIKSRKFHDCQLLTDSEVLFAFTKWFIHHLQSIESDASYYIRETALQFDRSIQDIVQEQDCPEDYEIASEEFEKMARIMDPNYVDNLSLLEDDFDGDAEEVAHIAAYNW